MAGHVDILEQQERLTGPFWGSLALHGGLVAAVVTFCDRPSVATRIQWGDQQRRASRLGRGECGGDDSASHSRPEESSRQRYRVGGAFAAAQSEGAAEGGKAAARRHPDQDQERSEEVLRGGFATQQMAGAAGGSPQPALHAGRPILELEHVPDAGRGRRRSRHEFAVWDPIWLVCHAAARSGCAAPGEPTMWIRG